MAISSQLILHFINCQQLYKHILYEDGNPVTYAELPERVALLADQGWPIMMALPASHCKLECLL